MSRSPRRGHLSLPLLTLALTVGVFAAREISGTAADGLAFFYLLPIALVALEFGLRAGLAFAAGAVVLVGVWDATSTDHLPLIGYGTRAALFFGAAVLCARMAGRLRRVARDGDRYFEMGDDMICTATVAGQLIRVNRRWTEVLGWTEDELTGHHILEFIHPDDSDHLAAEIARTLETGEAAVGLSNRVRTRDGRYRQVDWSVSLSHEGDIVYAAARDVTERHELERETRAAQERMHAAFDDAMTGIAVVGLHGAQAGVMLESNQALAGILGVEREAMLGSFTFGTYVHPEDIPGLTEAMRPLSDGSVDRIDTELRIVRPDGEVRLLAVRASALHDENGEPQYRMSQVLDITETRANEQQLRHLADHDPLSWLFNRRRFVADLEQELRANAIRHSRSAVLVVDLDGFKEVNDLAGHAAGDEVIKTVSLALIRRLRSGDVAGRLGGDEFGVLLRRVDPEHAVLVSHDLMRAVGEALAGLPQQVARDVTLSVGVAVVNGDASNTADDVLDRADRAMYRAKAAGGARVELAPVSPAVMR